MGTLSKLGLAGAVAVVGIGVLCNLPSNPFVPKPQQATLEYLANTKLQTFGSEQKEFLVKKYFCIIINRINNYYAKLFIKIFNIFISKFSLVIINHDCGCLKSVCVLNKMYSFLATGIRIVGQKWCCYHGC